MPSVRPALALTVSAACFVAGCGGGGAGGPGAEKLEQLIKIETAQALLTDTGVPTPPADSPRVREAVEQMDVDCESAGRRRYECAIGYGDFGRHCAIGTNASVTRLLWQECGTERPPDVKSDYVDCESVGEVVSAEDLIDPDEPLSPKPTGDLVRMRVAATSDRLCVEWQASAPVERPVFVHFWASPPSGERSALAGALESGRPPHIGTGPYGSLDGTLGVRGTTVALVIEREALPEPYQAVLDGQFTFTARGFGDALNPRLGNDPSYP